MSMFHLICIGVVLGTLCAVVDETFGKVWAFIFLGAGLSLYNAFANVFHTKSGSSSRTERSDDEPEIGRRPDR